MVEYEVTALPHLDGITGQHRSVEWTDDAPTYWCADVSHTTDVAAIAFNQQDWYVRWWWDGLSHKERDAFLGAALKPWFPSPWHEESHDDAPNCPLRRSTVSMQQDDDIGAVILVQRNKSIDEILETVGWQ